jgi:hypothetical protein
MALIAGWNFSHGAARRLGLVAVVVHVWPGKPGEGLPYRTY